MKLNRGINLGGYLSQCKHSQSHYAEFITEEDIKRIAGWGFDHVRLPFDFEVIEDFNGNTIKEGYELIHKIISWCKESKLEIILDLHKAHGYDFNDAGNKEKNNLFSDPLLQARFVELWKKIAKEFCKYENVTFELLNEVVESENAEAWNSLIDRTVNAIREICDTNIIYGGIQWNSPQTVRLLEKPKHKNIIFTFHFYEPLLFTHQKAHWVGRMDKNETVFYPKTMEYFKKQSVKLGDQGLAVINSEVKAMGAEFIESLVMEAIDAAKKVGIMLYCGEFGIIDQAPVQDTLRWFQDMEAVFTKHNIGCAIWTYKEKDFGLIGSHYDEIREDLISLWTNTDKNL